MNETSILIATPMYGGLCYGKYTQSLLEFTSIANEENLSFSTVFTYNESLITRARNQLVHHFLQTKATHLMFIDADIEFNPFDILSMLETKKKIICGIYPKKCINWKNVRQAIHHHVKDEDLKYHTGEFTTQMIDNHSISEDQKQPIEIKYGAAGFMLIEREVFQQLKPYVPVYKNPDHCSSNDCVYEFFATSIEAESKNLLSEDYHFCSLWKKLGGKVYGAPWVKLGHIGTYTFEGRVN